MDSPGTDAPPPSAEGPMRQPDDAFLREVLTGLYGAQLAVDPDNGYLREHAAPVAVDNQIRTFRWYRPYLSPGWTVLDWGCNHAPDSCLMRAAFGDRIELHSCDFVEAARFRVFHEYGRSAHRKLEDPVLLPFASDLFDAVIGSGVLEHTAMDYESLKELRRVLKPDGVLVISALPNRLSVQEWLRRVVRKQDFHRRLYGRADAAQLLKRSGFYPVDAGYHSFFWERLLSATGLGRWERSLTAAFKRLLPIHVFGSTLCFVARKVTVM
jgi:SAM-dependent methyltransferase